jgi:tetratricopeptide (TPR) repeat protein
LLWIQSQYEEAGTEFEQELANVPNHVQAMIYLADTNIKLEHPELALPLIQKVIRISPQTEMAHLDLDILYVNDGRQEDALHELNVPARLNPDDVRVHWRLARLYEAMGRKDEANAEWQKTSSLTKANESVLSKIDNTHKD